MITYTTYESYFTGLAEDYKPISHTDENPRFAFMDIDDILSLQRTAMNLDNPCMILENPEGELDFKNEKMRDANYGAFMILQRSAMGDAAKKRVTMDLTKQVGLALINKMHLDKVAYFKNQGSGIPRMLIHFDLSQVKYNKVGPIFSNAYGWRFEFNLAQETPLTYTEGDWYSND